VKKSYYGFAGSRSPPARLFHRILYHYNELRTHTTYYTALALPTLSTPFQEYPLHLLRVQTKGMSHPS